MTEDGVSVFKFIYFQINKTQAGKQEPLAIS